MSPFVINRAEAFEPSIVDSELFEREEGVKKLFGLPYEDLGELSSESSDNSSSLSSSI